MEPDWPPMYPSVAYATRMKCAILNMFNRYSKSACFLIKLVQTDGINGETIEVTVGGSFFYHCISFVYEFIDVILGEMHCKCGIVK